ncbi:response regulator [Candidatus Uabimicrobium amorphum]|uniref:Sensory/regulatory protein RpfC n=1 Tax=Uabimicrobium amorphum TaxID=2596890 RepID=A0A5S9II58_UABAM|nr:response regulator [Candidatus Uabimicrobium amorphum]BBM81916.1 histidine kinase [Candidatus Uabimicrobium amorphum]
MHILIAVKKELAIGSMLISAVRDNGYTPVVVSDGFEAWQQILKIHTFALVILQDDLEHMSGVEICRRLSSEQFKNMFYTVLVIENYSLAVSSKYVDDYITKTITPIELNVKINCILNHIHRYRNVFRQAQINVVDEILIVEDDDISRTVVASLIKKFGYHSCEAADGEQALEYFYSHSFPRIVILDWMLPKISGIDVCQKIRQMKNEEPIYIIFLTAKNTPEDIESGFYEGADDYLTKPFSVSELHARIEVGIRYVNTQLQIRKRIQEAEISYENIFQNSPQGVFRVNTKGELLLINPAFAKICGYLSSQEMKEEIKHISQLYGNTQYFQNISEKLQLNISICEETEIKCCDAQSKWISQQFTINYDGTGNQYIDAFVQDISERKKGELKLHKLNQHLEERVEQRTEEVEKAREFFYLILDTLPSHIAVLDEQGVIIFVNKAWRSFGDENGLGIEQHCVGSNYVDICLNTMGPERKEVVNSAYKLKQILAGHLTHFSHEYPCHSPKEDRWFNVHAVRFCFDGRAHVVVSHEKITELKLAEKESLKARDEARIANEAKSQFLANMSHEIRTPLNAIIGINTLMKNTHLTPRQLDYVHKVDLASRNLLAIINDILNLSKIESTKIQLESTWFDVHDVFERITSVCMLNIEQKQLDFIIEVDDDVPQQLVGDPVRLTQILINLINNATKFTEYGEVILRLSMHDKNDENFYLQFTVKDTGIGIPQERSEELFEAFTQADTSTTREYGGTGLGLSICKQLVQMMQGKIWVKSREGYGSEFSFIIPFVITEDHANAVETSRMERILQDDKTLEERTILIVEDNEINQEVIKELLEAQNLKTVIANNGLEALNMLKISSETEFCGILMDLQMPTMCGMEAIGLLRDLDHCKQIPVIALTGDVMSETKDSVLDAGFNDYLTKPVEVEELFRVLKKWLSSKKTEQENATSTEWQTLLNSIEGVNVEMGLQRVAGNENLYCKLLKQFFEKYIKLSSNLEELWENKDVEQLKKLCHMVKGTAGNLGMDTLYERMNELEKAIHLQTTNMDLFFREAYDEVCRIINTLSIFKDFAT